MSHTDPAAPGEPGPGPDVEREAERHASWPELFFDLVVVAGAGLLAHLIEDGEGWESLFLFVVAFGAFWMIWTCFTAYGNIRGDEARLPTFLMGMVVLSVMVAAVPGIHDDHAQAFAIAYVVGRVIAARPWHGATVVVDLPVIQAFTGVLPWIVSFWVEGDATYVWWAVGLALDLFQLLRSPAEKVVEGAQQRLDHLAERVERQERQFEKRLDLVAEKYGAEATRSDRAMDRRREIERRKQRVPSSIVALRADEVHLAERFSLFTLILLGEGLIQAITAASEATWDRTLAIAWAGGFALLVALWNLAVRRGSAGVALLPEGSIPVRVQWIAHLVTSVCLVAIAAVIGVIVADPAELVETHVAAVLTVALAAYLLYSAAIHLARGLRQENRDARRRGTWLAVVGVVAPGAAWLTHEVLSGEVIMWILAGSLLVLSAASHRIGHPHRPVRDGDAPPAEAEGASAEREGDQA